MDKIFYCTHAKGGAGNSLFATNFAFALSKKVKNKKVLFLDANQISDISHLFGIDSKKDILNLNMFLEGTQSNELITKESEKIFNKVAYQVNDLDILFSPKDYYDLNDLNLIYKNILTEAVKIYDYIIIDAERDNGVLLQEVLKNLHTLLVTTTVDNLAVTKTTSLLNLLKENIAADKIKVVCNQVGTFAQKDLENIFEVPLAVMLPTEINGAWDNVLLGTLIVGNERLAYSRQVNKCIDDVLSE